MIVEAKPGTTLDAIDAHWHTDEGEFVLVDTAGIRRQAMFRDEAEYFAVLRAHQAMERAHVACIIVDATEGFQRQDARLAQDALDAGRSVQLLYNKWDLLEDREALWKRLTGDRERRYPTLADLPAMPISATVRTHIQKLPKVFRSRMEEMNRSIPTSRLNQWLGDVQKRRQIPANRMGRAPRLYYMTQSGHRPPEFTFFVNGPEKLNESYRRFLWTRFVEQFGFRGTPVRFRFRKSE